MANRKICVIGLGYVGLPTACLLAKNNYDVIGVDINEHIVKSVNMGISHISEKYINNILSEAVSNNKLFAASKPCTADIFIITVPTPVSFDKSPDISSVLESTLSIIPCLKPGNIVILESTCPIGTTEFISEMIQNERPDLHVPLQSKSNFAGVRHNTIFVSYCPERILPGNTFNELIANSRIIGGLDDKSAQATKTFFKTYVEGKLLVTDSKTAEMVKLCENTFRDINIAYSNELAMIAAKYNINPSKVIELANFHPRVSIHDPGIGVGGHCIPVDPWFLYHGNEDVSTLIKTARSINDAMPQIILNKIISAISNIQNPQIALLGLSYKPNSDDLRNSPAVEIVKLLHNCLSSNSEFLGFNIFIVEPHIDKLPKYLSDLNSVFHCKTIDVTKQRIDICAVLVNHNQFKSIITNSNSVQPSIIIDPVGGMSTP